MDGGTIVEVTDRYLQPHAKETLVSGSNAPDVLWSRGTWNTFDLKRVRSPTNGSVPVRAVCASSVLEKVPSMCAREGASGWVFHPPEDTRKGISAPAAARPTSGSRAAYRDATRGSDAAVAALHY